MADSAGLMPALPQEPEPAEGPAGAGPRIRRQPGAERPLLIRAAAKQAGCAGTGSVLVRRASTSRVRQIGAAAYCAGA
jgi:hypothetical protein